MKNIAIIIPLHKLTDETFEYLDRAINSVAINQENYNYALAPFIICNKKDEKCIREHYKGTPAENIQFIINDTENTDFCSQINYAVDKLNADEYQYFSILEFDDVYTNKWFKSVKEYYYTHEDVSIFLPINVEVNDEDGFYQYVNEMAWANQFSKEIGFIDRDCIEEFYSFNLTGGVFNTDDFKKIGGFRINETVAFNYDLLIRLLNKGLKVYVVPKEGYCHLINREDSLSKLYKEKYTPSEMLKIFANVKKFNEE